MFLSRPVQFYDKFYASKNYQAEVIYLCKKIAEHCQKLDMTLLDVACGTGEHAKFFKQRFAVEGLDISPDMLALARRKNPDLRFFLGDMRDFELNGRYDVVVCLFSSIGYLLTLEEVAQAVGNMKRHLNPGGVILIEPWFTPQAFREGTIHSLHLEEMDLKLVRMSTSLREGRISIIDRHYLIGTPEGVEHYVEYHRLALYTVEEMKKAFVGNNLKVDYDPAGPTGRGLYLGWEG